MKLRRRWGTLGLAGSIKLRLSGSSEGSIGEAQACLQAQKQPGVTPAVFLALNFRSA
jgi:hypothetical protein